MVVQNRLAPIVLQGVADHNSDVEVLSTIHVTWPCTYVGYELRVYIPITEWPGQFVSTRFLDEQTAH